jgi:putative peptide zinc metalloprotease protein
VSASKGQFIRSPLGLYRAGTNGLVTVAVYWAGPYLGIILSGMASIIITVWPEFVANSVLFQLAFLSYLTVIINLNPLPELDGYYILMDWLEIPMLRPKSLEFTGTGLLDKLKRSREAGTPVTSALGAFSREEGVFAGFGLLSAAWKVYAIYTGPQFWQARLVSSLRSLWTQGGDPGKILMSLVAAGLSAQELCDYVFEHVDRFQAGARQYDDMALLVVKANAG